MGKLFYVIGASGAGKDTLMNYARKHLNKQDNCLFAHRYITRPIDPTGENHVQLTRDEFIQRKEKQLFALDWFSHETLYGIGKEIDLWLNKGCNVIVNGSRGYLGTALQKYPEMHVVLIEVDPDLLKSRLINRGRETEEQIEKRLQRAREYAEVEADQLIRFKNNEDISVTGPAFVDVLSKAHHQQTVG